MVNVSRNADVFVECPFCRGVFAWVDAEAEAAGDMSRTVWNEEAAADAAELPELNNSFAMSVIGERTLPSGRQQLLVSWADSHIDPHDFDGDFDAAVAKQRQIKKRAADARKRKRDQRASPGGVQRSDSKGGKRVRGASNGAAVSTKWVGWNVWWPSDWDQQCRGTVRDADRRGRIVSSCTGSRNGSVWWKARFDDAVNDDDCHTLTKTDMEKLHKAGYLYKRAH